MLDPHLQRRDAAAASSKNSPLDHLNQHRNSSMKITKKTSPPPCPHCEKHEVTLTLNGVEWQKLLAAVRIVRFTPAQVLHVAALDGIDLTLIDRQIAEKFGRDALERFEPLTSHR